MSNQKRFSTTLISSVGRGVLGLTILQMMVVGAYAETDCDPSFGSGLVCAGDIECELKDKKDLSSPARIFVPAGTPCPKGYSKSNDMSPISADHVCLVAALAAEAKALAGCPAGCFPVHVPLQETGQIVAPGCCWDFLKVRCIRP